MARVVLGVAPAALSSPMVALAWVLREDPGDERAARVLADLILRAAGHGSAA